MKPLSSIEYIITFLKIWERNFPNIVICYTFKKDTGYHIITVGPNELYRYSPDYINAENVLWNSFSERYPNENILITEPKNSLKMENILYPYLTDVPKQELNERRIDVYKYLV